MRVYTDGACSGNPGPGGWAWATTDGKKGSGSDPDTTNQRMELMAVLQAARSLDGQVDVYSDSTYVVNCFKDKWYEGWLRRGWKNSQKKPVANRDIWEPLITEYLLNPDRMSFQWVKGHSGNEMNDLVDALAVAEVDKLKAVSLGVPLPVEVEAPWPTDKSLAVVGVAVTDMAEAQRSIDGLKPDWVVVSGLRRGLELDLAEYALDSDRVVGVVLPFSNPVVNWTQRDHARFEVAYSSAKWTVNLERPKADPRQALMERNTWLRSCVTAVLTGDAALADWYDQAGISAVVV